MINVFNGPIDPMNLEEFAEERQSRDGEAPVFQETRRRAVVTYTDDGRKMLDGKLQEESSPAATDALWSTTITRGVAKEWKERAHGNIGRRAARYVSNIAYEIRVLANTTGRKHLTLILVILNIVLLFVCLNIYSLPPF